MFAQQKSATSPTKHNMQNTIAPPHKRNGPNGWDFEDLRGISAPPNNLRYAPWTHCAIDPLADDTTDQPVQNPTTLILGQLAAIADEHKGSGVVVDEDSLVVVGCYKVYAVADSRAQETDADILRILDDVDAKERGMAALEAVAESEREADHAAHVDALKQEVVEIHKEEKVLRGRRLDQRPVRIARHDPPVFAISKKMNGAALGRFAKRYDELWAEHVQRHGYDLDLEDEDLPLWREPEFGV
ncbi:hypothetical protein BDV95DRAFT_557752 [Massariosphaeria phaeospora]|uniref:Uncharacterized protein n=1 Tax=Massariosphaeria phaeospora TaxID=100035 RepID=A0A7C8IFT3_9PLEO|nr:hypothetical protein BDV95DRAFT_557752 [Massariosphaeria phaeospora]